MMHNTINFAHGYPSVVKQIKLTIMTIASIFQQIKKFAGVQLCFIFNMPSGWIGMSAPLLPARKNGLYKPVSKAGQTKH